MKVRLNFSLPTVAVMLSMMAVSGYAHPGDSHQQENAVLENPLTVTPVEKGKVGPEVTGKTIVENQPSTSEPATSKGKVGREVTGKTIVENEPSTSEPASTKDSMVSDWLEARATEIPKSSVEEAISPVQDPETEGGGWCDLCGCWDRHGCDPNGNCHIMHIEVCGGGGSGCYMHAGACYSSS